ncbi:hypothetical protein GTA08_BOTSDO02640 [Neofusicoccum parvum]|nr:hypothetical protein GTA08_BOTSDO02640 [Neofusicoccum parvum]
MESFEQSIESYFKDQDQPLPRVTLGAINKAGTFSYVKSFGGQSGTPDADVPDTSDVYWIASCSKLITTIVALQCVDKGLLNLDDDISGILPEWKDPKILVGFEEDGQPILKPAESFITLRHLLTHTAGMAYRDTHPLIQEYDERRGRPEGFAQTIAHDFPTLLVAPPGTRWRYSPSLDWAGQMIERVNPGLKLGDLIQRDILAPLHLPATALTFHLPPAAPSSPPRVARAWQRRASGSLRPLASQAIMPDPVADDFGGRGLYATAGAWLAVAGALLAGGAPLLRPGTAAGVFAAQMAGPVAEGLAEEVRGGLEMRNGALGSLPDGVAVGFGLGGLVNREGVRGRRAAGSLCWSGLPNCYWWIDPEKGVAGVYLSQLMPTGDSKSVELLGKFEEAVYAAVGQS